MPLNLYVVVEGRRTEPRLYGAWLPMLVSGLVRVRRVEDVSDRTFFIVAGEGYPSYLRRIQAAVLDVRQNPAWSHLVVCVDAEERSVSERRAEVSGVILREGCPVPHSVIVADCCIESWLLGNRKFIRRDPEGVLLREYLAFYDVRQRDPERMGARPPHEIRAHSHLEYLREAFRERGLSYSKENPGEAASRPFLEQLEQRTVAPRDGTPAHLQSFAELLRVTRALGDASG